MSGKRFSLRPTIHGSVDRLADSLRPYFSLAFVPLDSWEGDKTD